MKPLRRNRFFYLGAAFAAVYALWIHAQFLTVLPDPFFQPDSNGYLVPALDWLYGRSLHMGPARTLGYPLWIFLLLKMSPHFETLLIAQHAVVLFASAALGFLAYRAFKTSRWTALAIFFLAAALPRLMVYSHTLLSDALYAGCLTLNIFALTAALEKSEVKRWIAVAIGAWAGLLIRPVGISFVIVAGAVMLLRAVRGTERRACRAGILTFAVLCFLSSSANYALRGFWGFDQFGSVSLFGSTARYLSPAWVENSPFKTSLSPIYQNNRVKLEDFNWVLYDPQGPVAALGRSDPNRLNHTLLYLAVKGISQHPWLFARDQTALFLRFFWDRSARPSHIYPKEFSAARGFEFFSEAVREQPLAANLVVFNPATAREYFGAIAHHPLYPYEPTLATRLLWPWAYGVRWIGLLALFLTPFLWTKKALRPLIIAIWAAIFLHILVSDLGADGDSRHAIPVEPLYLLMMMAGLDAALHQRILKTTANINRSIAKP